MVKQNLKQLNTDYFDLMLIHMPSNAGPLRWCDSTWKLLEEYHAKGIFKAVATKYNVSAAQVATRWLYQQDHVFVFLSSNPDHQANSADFMGFELSDEDMQTLS